MGVTSLVNVGAIVGSALGGFALATVAFFFISYRTAFFGKASSTESQPLVPNGIFSQREVSMQYRGI
jgi:hypothetical protein